MGAITVRNLPDDVLVTIKARARSHGRSMEAELRAIIGAAASRNPQTESAEDETRTSATKRVWMSGDEVMRAVEDWPKETTGWAGGHRNRPYDDDALEDPWERQSRAAS